MCSFRINFSYTLVTQPPILQESCVFGQLINIGSVLLGINIWVRYRQILQLFEHHSDLGNNPLRYNRLAVWFGLSSCLGISIVGNFQETNVRIVHLLEAFRCLEFGTLYFWMHALFSYMIYLIASSKRNAHLRMGMAVCCVILFILLTVTGVMTHILYKGLNPRKCYPPDGGWYFHVISSVFEWIIATVFSFYILTCTDEFRDVDVDHSQLRLMSYSLTLQ